MRKAKILGKDIYLTEEIWSQLVGRFDVDKVKKSERGTKVEIPIGCFCVGISCSRCPLQPLRRGDIYGCTRILRHLCGTSNLAFNVSMVNVSWWEEDDKKARRQVQKVYTALMCMKQIKR